MINALLVEDNPGDVRLIVEMIADADAGSIAVESVDTLRAAVERLDAGGVDVLLVDLGLPDSQGLETLAMLRGVAPDVAAIVLTGNADLSLAVEAVKEGAQDYLVKGRVDGELLVRAISYAIGKYRAERAVEVEHELLARAEQIAALGSWRFDVATGEMLWSDEMYRIFEVTPEDLERDFRSAIDNAVHPDDRGAIRDFYNKLLGDPSPGSLRLRAFSRGEMRWIDVQGRVEQDEHCGVKGITGFAQDVTDLKIAQDRVARDTALDKAIASMTGVLVALELPIEETAALVLGHAVALTASQHGLVWHVDPVTGDGTVHTLNGGADGSTERAQRLTALAQMLGSGAIAEVLGGRDLGAVAFCDNAPGLDVRPPMIPDGHFDVHRILSAPAIAGGRALGQIIVANSDRDYTDEDVEAVERLARLYAAALVRAGVHRALQESETSLRESNRRLEHMVYGVAEAIGRIVEVRDPYTQGHEVRVARLSKLIAEEMGLPQEDIDAIEMSALVHDIGKMSVPAEILTKPGALAEVEMALIREHAQAGYSILKGIDFPWPVADIVLQHHERADGSGYPFGLSGDEILPAARIISLADVVEAMASHRPYRAALGLHAAMDEIRDNPQRYDPEVAATCTGLYAAGRIDL